MKEAGVRWAGVPWLTLALLATLVAVFGCELAAGVDQRSGWLEPSLRTLVELGGSNRRYVVDGGEWYRIIAAPFLHAGPLHLGLNGIVLLWGGSILERLLGRAWFAAIYAVSGVTGSLMSLAVNPPSVVSIGASGALMGVMAALFMASFHFPSGPVRSQLRTAALQVLVPSMLPIVTAVTGERVDFGAHLGGALGGAFVALVMLGLWPRSEPQPRARWLAAAIGLAGLAAVIFTAWKVEGSFLRTEREAALRGRLIPNSQLPSTDAEWKAQVDSLADRYPHDPRPRLVRGMTRLDAGDLAGAERDLRAGLADAQDLKDMLSPQVEALLRTNLAIALAGDKQNAEAKTVAEPVCRLGNAETRRLKRLGLCD